MSKIFAVIYTPGPAWDADKPVWDQELQLHDDYLHSLFLAGKLREGGPFSDSGGGPPSVTAAVGSLFWKSKPRARRGRSFAMIRP